MAKSRRKKSAMKSGHGLGVIQSVQAFREQTNQSPALTPAKRMLLIEQAEILLSEIYTHKPLKQAMHSVDQIQRLKLLRQRVDDLSVLDFHMELLDIFKSLRDLHTNYVLPAPFAGKIAFLGILVERYFEGDSSRWLVSKVAEHLVSDAALTVGAELTHWNGMPIEMAVWRNADKEAGSNLSARLARGLETLTLRFLSSSFAPDEDWVNLTYKKGSTVHETRLNWQIFDGGADLTAGAADPDGLIRDLTVPLRYDIGMDVRAEQLRQSRKKLFNRFAVKEEKRCKRYKGKVPRATQAMASTNALPTTRPDEISAKIVTTDSGEFGYLRLWTFHMQDSNINAYINEVIRLLSEEMPPEGLILDVRGNGGGFIIAAEFLLQLLTPSYIKPEPSQFIATASTLDMVKNDSSLDPWKLSLEQAVSTGALYSAGIPLSGEDIVNSFGQIYFGPVVLITDAYCYSACDMFAAGFQDHHIGTIIGVDEKTGAGGANVVTHDDVRDIWADGPLAPLPSGVGMRVSFRRTLRVGEREGEPIEDVGVTRDVAYQMTEQDLLNSNTDLLERAGEILSEGVPRVFNVALAGQGQLMDIDIDVLNVNSVDVYVDDRPVMSSQSVVDGSNNLQIQLPSSGASVRIDGFDNQDLVASRLINLS